MCVNVCVWACNRIMFSYREKKKNPLKRTMKKLKGKFQKVSHINSLSRSLIILCFFFYYYYPPGSYHHFQ